MPCDNITPLLPDHCTRMLDEATSARVERHLASCPDCAAMAADLSALFHELDALKRLHAGSTPRHELVTAVNAGIDARQRREMRIHHPLRFAAGLAAGVLLIVGIGMVGNLLPAGGIGAPPSMLLSLIDPSDSMAVRSVEQFVDEHQDVAFAWHDFETQETGGLADSTLAEAMFADVPYEDVVIAAGSYIGTDAVLDFIPSESVPSNDSRIQP